MGVPVQNMLGITETEQGEMAAQLLIEPSALPRSSNNVCTIAARQAGCFLTTKIHVSLSASIQKKNLLFLL